MGQLKKISAVLFIISVLIQSCSKSSTEQTTTPTSGTQAPSATNTQTTGVQAPSGTNTQTSSTQASSTQASSTQAPVVQKVLDGFKKDYTNSGIVAVARKSDGTLDFGVFGNSEATVPLATTMSLGIASITKNYTAALIFKLIEENKLSLTDDLNKLLPTRVNDNINGTITVKQLLNHSSGISDPIEINNDLINAIFANPSYKYSIDEFLAKVQAPPFVNGTTHGYSNVNYILLGLIIEKVTGKKYHEYLRQEIITPLNLSNTFLISYETPTNTIGYSWDPKGDNLNSSFSRNGIESVAWSAGSIFATVEDLATWYHALFNNNFLSDASLKTMQTTVDAKNGDTVISYGHGTFSKDFLGDKVFYNAGQTIAYQSFVLYSTNTKNVVVVIINNSQSDPSPIAYSILTELYK